MKSLSRVRLFVTPWTVAYQSPPSMEFSRQWSGLTFPSPEDLPKPGIEPRSPALQADALLSEPPGKPQKDKVVLKETAGHREKLAGMEGLNFLPRLIPHSMGKKSRHWKETINHGAIWCQVNKESWLCQPQFGSQGLGKDV